MDCIYNLPKYYEIAFSFRDIIYETNVMEECIKGFSKIPVGRILEVGCGNCPHMLEFLKRNYEYIGLDSSSIMLDYSKLRALNAGLNIELIQGNMVDFSIQQPVDFVYIMLGSIYVDNTDELISHFDSISRALKKGGLYFMDGCIRFGSEVIESWEIERDCISIKIQYSDKVINPLEQIFKETIIFEVDDNRSLHHFVQESYHRVIYPQEFLLLLKSRNDFELVGWWNNWDLTQPLDGNKPINRDIIVLRKIR